MVLLMLTTEAMEWHWDDKCIARQWLSDEGVEVKARRFDFDGRMQMVGAIQVFSGSETTDWRDPLIAPHPRRSALFAELGLLPKNGVGSSGCATAGLSMFDRNWIALQADLVSRSASVLLEELGKACNAQ